MIIIYVWFIYLSRDISKLLVCFGAGMLDGLFDDHKSMMKVVFYKDSITQSDADLLVEKITPIWVPEDTRSHSKNRKISPLLPNPLNQSP